MAERTRSMNMYNIRVKNISENTPATNHLRSTAAISPEGQVLFPAAADPDDDPPALLHRWQQKTLPVAAFPS